MPDDNSSAWSDILDYQHIGSNPEGVPMFRNSLGEVITSKTFDKAWRKAFVEQIGKRQQERQQDGLIGIDPDQPWHFIDNPSREEVEQRERSLIDSIAQSRARERTASQELHWRQAVKLIREGGIQSYADLAQRFTLSNHERYLRRMKKDAREGYSAEWAYHLVRKMIVRNVFTLEEVQQLIADTSSPFKKPKQPSTK